MIKSELKWNYDLTALAYFKLSKAFPLHAMVALGGRGDIAPIHSLPRH
jgi:hypothetical protein